MCDFLKAFPFVTMEQYLWEYSIPLIRLMSADVSHVLYLTEKQMKEYQAHNATNLGEVYTDPEKFMKDLGFPVFN